MVLLPSNWILYNRSKKKIVDDSERLLGKIYNGDPAIARVFTEREMLMCFARVRLGTKPTGY